MSVLVSIRDHSGRIYRAVQFALLVSIASLCSLLFWLERPANAGWAATLSFSSALAALAGMIYLQRSIAVRLQLAAVAQEERAKLLECDFLTGAYSRRRFLELLEDALGSALNPNEATLMLLDLDHFKQLNDSLGHAFGDIALRDVVEKATQVFPDAVIGRLGGDEFAILVAKVDNADLQARARQLIEALHDGRRFEGNVVSISVSIGMAEWPRHAVDSSELMIMADVALYESKAGGRGRVTRFDQEMLSTKQHQRFLERELRAAIYLNELELHYQPITNADGSIHGQEALVRWRHGSRGMIQPAEFIPAAERSNLIDLLGAWVFRRACHDLPRLAGERISVNVSGAQLRSDHVVETFKRILEETGSPANRFTIEITETVATTASPEVLARLSALRALGFLIALDDFGTGNCGFNYLKHLPIDTIKIDRSYIQVLGSDRVAQVFVLALTEIAEIQHITTVAEGIETATEMALATAAGCSNFQGFYLGRPQPLATPSRLVKPERLSA